MRLSGKQNHFLANMHGQMSGYFNSVRSTIMYRNKQKLVSYNYVKNPCKKNGKKRSSGNKLGNLANI